MVSQQLYILIYKMILFNHWEIFQSLNIIICVTDEIYDYHNWSCIVCTDV